MSTDEQLVVKGTAEEKSKVVKKKPDGVPPNIEPKPKLSKAERRALQEKQRAEKAARSQQPQQGAGAGASKAIPKQQSEQPSQSKPLQPHTKQPEARAAPVGSKEKQSQKNDPSSKQVSLSSSFNAVNSATNKISLVSHLSPYQDPSKSFHCGATIRPINCGDADTLHPCVIQTGYLFATGQIRGGNARCRAMLRCYLRLIRDFVPPTLSSTSQHTEDMRHVIDQVILKPAFQYWTEYCRPHSVSMGNAFSFLKTATASSLDRDMTWPEMSIALTEIIQAYERERIDFADVAIAEIACQKILFSKKRKDGEVFLTFGNSEAIRVVLQQAAQSSSLTSSDDNSTFNVGRQSFCNRNFRVIVVDSRPLLEGQEMLRYLRKLNIECSYCLLSAVTYVLKDVTKVLLGASSLSSDGSVFGRVGTAVIAMAAHHQHIPVLFFSETYKISYRVFTESITSNEIGDPDEVIIPIRASNKNEESKSDAAPSTDDVKRLNLLYDLTPAEFVSGIVTELGIVPPTSIAVLLREMNSQNIK